MSELELVAYAVLAALNSFQTVAIAYIAAKYRANGRAENGRGGGRDG